MRRNGSYPELDIDTVLVEIIRIRDCIEAARALTERSMVPSPDRENADECRDAAEALLCSVKWHIIDPLWDYINNSFVPEGNKP